MATRAADIMTKDVTVIREEETMLEAAERLAQDGVLTDRDIVVHVIARGKDPANTLRPDDSIEHACDLMAQHKVRRLPVVEEGRVVGS